MVYNIVLARFLGPDNFGLLQLGISVMVIFGTIARFGFVGALPRYIPFLLEKNEKGKAALTIKFSLKFVVLIGIIIGVILWFTSPLISVNFFNEPDLVFVLRTFAIFFPLLAVYKIFSSLIRAFQGSKHKVILFDIGIRILRIVLFAPFLIIGYLLFGAIIAYIVGSLVISLITLLIIDRYHFSFITENYGVKDTSIKKEFLSFSWPLALTGFTYLFISTTDKILLGFFTTSDMVGIYTAALMLAGMLKFIQMSFTWVFLPTISKAVSNKKLDKVERLFKVSSKWMFTIALPFFLFILLFSEEIITFLYGLEYSVGYTSLIILSIGISMNTLTGLTGNILVANGNTKLNLGAEVVGAITNVSLNIILIPLFGIVGAAIGTSASYFTRNYTSLGFVYKKIKIHPFKKNIINVISSGLITLIIFYIITRVGLVFPWLGVKLVFYGLGFLGLYFILLFPLKALDDDDKYILKLILNKFGMGIFKR